MKKGERYLITTDNIKEQNEQCKDLIPEYAGVFTITKYEDKGFARCVKSAPKKQCRKLSTEEQLKIARLGVMRIWNLKQKYQRSTL